MGEEDADVDEEPSQDDSEEIEGVIENPLFEPEQDVNISSIEKFSMDAIDDDDLDFEPDIEEANDQGKSSKSMESECRTSPGREENETAGSKDDKEDDEGFLGVGHCEVIQMTLMSLVIKLMLHTQ